MRRNSSIAVSHYEVNRLVWQEAAVGAEATRTAACFTYESLTSSTQMNHDIMACTGHDIIAASPAQLCEQA